MTSRFTGRSVGYSLCFVFSSDYIYLYYLWFFSSDILWSFAVCANYQFTAKENAKYYKKPKQTIQSFSLSQCSLCFMAHIHLDMNVCKCNSKTKSVEILFCCLGFVLTSSVFTKKRGCKGLLWRFKNRWCYFFFLYISRRNELEICH